MSPYRPLPAGVRRFRLDPACFRSLVARIIGRRVALGAAIAMPLLVLATSMHGARARLSVVAYGALLVILAIILVWRWITLDRQLAPLLDRFELLVSGRVLRRAGVGPVAEVLRPEIGELVETKAGLWVTCKTPRRSLFVTRGVDGYTDIREAVAAWGPIRELSGWAALRYAWREKRHAGPRDAIRGTALETDETLVRELEEVRAASAHGLGGALVPTPGAGRKIAVWGAVIVGVLALWQILEPGERKLEPMTDTQCQQMKGCQAWGLCKADGYRCSAATDADCAQSDACTKLRRCKSVGGSCHGDRDESMAP